MKYFNYPLLYFIFQSFFMLSHLSHLSLFISLTILSILKEGYKEGLWADPLSFSIHFAGTIIAHKRQMLNKWEKCLNT